MKNKKFISFIGVGVITLAAVFIFGMPKAQAADGFTVVGDFPNDGRNYRVEAYDAVQANPCDGVADGGGDILYFSTTYPRVGNADFDANDDYSASYGTALAVPTTVYFYMCSPGQGPSTADLIVSFNKTVTNDDDIELDLGRALGGNSVHNGLINDYIHVCDALSAGAELTTEDYQTNGVTAEYQAYYYMWEPSVTEDGGNLDDIYIYFDTNVAAPCVLDNSKDAGVYVNPDISLPYDYGVYVTFEPETLATDSIHTDIDTAGYISVYTGTTNIGMTGAAEAIGTYNLYYDNAAAGTLSINAYTAVDTTIKETISGLALGFVTQKIDRRISGSIPTDITEVKEVIGGITYSTVDFTPDPDHNNYALYIPSDAGAQDLLFLKGATTEFSENLNANVGDAVANVRKITGEAHGRLEDALADNIEVWADASCAVTQRDANAVLVQPVDNGAGVDYAVYFDDQAEAVYIQADKDGTYKTCGMKVADADFGIDQTATVDLNIMVNGTVATGIDVAAVDKDALDSDATDADSCEAFANVNTNLYYLFASTNGEADYVDATSNVFFVAAGGLGTELLETGKNLTADKQVDVGRVIGDTHADFQTAAGGADDIQVYSDAAASIMVSSELVQPVAGGGANDDFTQYYEATGGDTSYYFWGQANFDPDAGGGCAAETFETIATFAGGGGQSDILDVTNKVEGLVYGGATNIASVAVDIDNAGGWDYYTKEVNHCATDKDYKVYVTDAAAAATEDSIVFYTGTDPASWTELLDTKDLSGTYVANTFVDLSADEVMGASRISGAADASFRAAGAGSEAIEVYDTYAVPAAVTNRLNSTSVVTDGADSYYLFIIQDNDADIVGNTLDLKIIDQNNYASYIFDTIFPTAGAGNITSGSDTDYDLTEKITGDTPVGTDVIYIEDSNVPGTYFATGIPDAASGVYAIYIDATKKGAAVGTYRFEVQEPALTQVLRSSSNVGAAAPLTDETFNVAKVSGNVHDDATSIGVHDAVDCSGVALNNLDVDPGIATTYSRYFEGVDGGSYYMKVADATYFTCRTTELTVTNQLATANFAYKLSGRVPDTDATITNDVLSVSIADIANYWSDTVNGGTTDYAAYIAGGVSVGALFKDTLGGGGATLLQVNKAVAADTVINVSAANGATHVNLEFANAVCGTYRTSNGTCANPYSTVPAAAAGAAYEIFFEEQGGAGNYYLETLDTDAEDYYAWDLFTTGGTAGSYITVDLGGKLSGTVREAYDATLGIPLALVGMYTDTLVWPANEVARAYSYGAAGEQASPAGNYRMYGPAGTYDAQASKAGYITNVKTDFGALDVAWNWDMASGIEVTVQDGGGNPITYATVEIYSCGVSADPADCTTLANTCVNTPTADCTRTGDNSNGNGANGYYDFAGIATGTYIQIRVTDPSVPPIFDAVYSPDASETVNSFVISDTVALTQTVPLYNLPPSCTLTVAGGVGTYERSGMVYAAIGQDVSFRMDCGETGLTVGADVTGLTAVAAVPVDVSGVYTFTSTVDAGILSGEKTITVTANDGVNQTTRGIAVTVDADAPATVLTVNSSGTPDTDGSVQWDWNAAADNAGGSGLRFYNVKIAADDDDCSGGVIFQANVDTIYLPYAILPTGATYYACVVAVDHVGNPGTQYNSTGILVDTNRPTAMSVLVGEGKTYITDKDAVIVDYAGQDVTTYSLSCDGSTWVALGGSGSDTIDLDAFGTCTPAEGVKTFYLKGTDVNGNDSGVVSDDVILDITAPDESGVIVTATVDAINLGQVNVTWAGATDATSGIASYTVYRNTTGVAVAVSDTKVISGLTDTGFTDAFSTNGTYYYAITITDKAGLTSAISATSAAATVDVEGPTSVAITINSDALYTADPAVTLTVSAVDAANMQFSCDGTTWDGPVGYDTTAAFNLNTGAGCVAGNGLKTVYVAMIDATTIKTTYAFDFITLGTAPTVTQVPVDEAEISPLGEINITFSEAMDLGTISAVTVQLRNFDDNVQIPSFITKDATDPNTFIIDPWFLSYSGHYYIWVSGVKSAVGIPMVDHITAEDNDFTTAAYVATPPTIISWAPGDGVEIGINVNPQENVISLTFDQRIYEGDIDTDNIKLLDSDDNEVTLSNLVYTLVGGKTVVSLLPAASLTYNTDYHITVNNVRDFAHGDAIVAWDSEVADGLFSTIPEPNGALGMWATTTQNKPYALNDGNWPNFGTGAGGWAWTMHVTVPIDELDVSMKFDNWTGVGGASIPAANYIRYYSDEAVVGQGDSTTKRLITAPINLYGTAMTINPALDTNLNMDGIQIDIHIETKIPTTSTAGGYSTQYGIQSLP